MQSLSFSVAGVRFVLAGGPDCPALQLHRQYDPFISDGAPPAAADAVYNIVSPGLDPAAPTPADWLWQSGPLRVWRSESGRWRVDIGDGGGKRWLAAADLSDGFGSGSVFLRHDLMGLPYVMPFHHPHDEAIILARLAHIGAGIVHSSCVVLDGRAFLFVGQSGAGKTTLARVWRTAGAILLNDERNIVRKSNGVVMAGSSPWHGEENQVNSATAPLAGVFYLRQDVTNSVREVAIEESIARLFTTTFVPVFLEEGPRLLLNAWADILSCVPSFELGFTPDRRAIETCRHAAGVA